MDILHAPRPPPDAARSSAAPRSAAAASAAASSSSSSSSCRTAAAAVAATSAAGDELESAWRTGAADVVEVEADERQGCIVAQATRDLLRLSDERRVRRAAEDAELAARDEVDDASAAALVACDVAFSAGLDVLACAEAEAARRSRLAAAEGEARAAAAAAAQDERRAWLRREAAATAAAELAAAELRVRVREEGAEREERAALLAGERGAWLRARGVELAASSSAEGDEDAQALETCLMQERRRLREEERAAAERQRRAEEAYVEAQGRHIGGMLALERGELAGYEEYMRLRLVDDEAHAFLTDVLNPKQAQLFAAGEGYVRRRLEALRGAYVAYVLDRLCCEGRADVARAHAAALGRLASDERSAWLAARRAYTERSDRETRALHRRLEQESRTRAEAEQRRADARAAGEGEEAAARAAVAAEEHRARGVLREDAEGSVRAAVVAVITRQVEAEVEAATLHWTPETWEVLHTQQLAAREVLEAERASGVRAMESAETQAYIAARAAEVAANPDTLSFLRLYRAEVAPPDAATVAAAAAAEEDERAQAAAAAACYAAAADERACEQRERLRVLKEKWEEERHARDLESLRREQEAAEQCEARREEAARRQRERARREDAAFVELQEAHGRTLVTRAWAEGMRGAAEEAAATAGLDLAAPSGGEDGAGGSSQPPSRLPGGDEHQQQVALLVEAELRKREIFEGAERRHTGVLERAFRDGQLEVLFPHTGGSGSGGVEGVVAAQPPVVVQAEDAVPTATTTAAAETAATLEGLLQAPGGAMPSATPPCSPALLVSHSEGWGFGNTDSDDDAGSNQAVNAVTVARGLAGVASSLGAVHESGNDVTPCNSPLFPQDAGAFAKTATACPDNVDGAPTTVEQAMQKVRDLGVLSGEG